VFPHPTQKHSAAVGNLGLHNRARNQDGTGRIVRATILFPPQQYVAIDRPLHPCEKLAMLGEKAECDIFLNANSTQKPISGGLHETWPKQTMPERVCKGTRKRFSCSTRTRTVSPSLARYDPWVVT
jgi:hypothetical protein